jgi:hypothetical protein
MRAQRATSQPKELAHRALSRAGRPPGSPTWVAHLGRPPDTGGAASPVGAWPRRQPLSRPWRPLPASLCVATGRAPGPARTARAAKKGLARGAVLGSSPMRTRKGLGSGAAIDAPKELFVGSCDGRTRRHARPHKPPHAKRDVLLRLEHSGSHPRNRAHPCARHCPARPDLPAVLRDKHLACRLTPHRLRPHAAPVPPSPGPASTARLSAACAASSCAISQASKLPPP